VVKVLLPLPPLQPGVEVRSTAVSYLLKPFVHLQPFGTEAFTLKPLLRAAFSKFALFFSM
jgi:hypothetical protein